MTIAHAGIMSGHQGVYRTQERITANFWWPGMMDDVTQVLSFLRCLPTDH